jgi:hypothetical protein
VKRKDPPSLSLRVSQAVSEHEFSLMSSLTYFYLFQAETSDHSPKPEEDGAKRHQNQGEERLKSKI